MNILHRFLICSFLFSLGLFLFLKTFPPPVQAQTYNTNVSSLLPNTAPDVPRDTHTLVQSLTIDMLSTITCLLAGTDPITQNHQCVGYSTQTKQLVNVPSNGGAFGLMVHAIAYSYTPPAHVSQYFSYVAQNFHPLGSPSYAVQNNSIGFTGLQQLLPIWVVMRNVAYLFVVVIFILVGFAIMLRIKIDPRTVMTVQNTIPKIVIGLLLITFSYAIAGLLIDITWVLIILLLNLVAQATQDKTIVNTLVTSSDPYSAMNSVFGQFAGIGGIAGPVANAAGLIGNIVATAINSNIVGAILNGILTVLAIPLLIYNIICWISGFFGSGCQAVSTLQILANAFVFIALLIAVLSALFKFWISLVVCYINILFAIILAPLRILVGMLPGAPGGGVGGWFRDLVANLMVFPITLTFILLAGELAKISASTSSNTPSIFVFPMLPGFEVGGMLALVSMIAILPKLPDQIKETFKTKDTFGLAFGQALGGGIKSEQKTIGTGVSMVAPTPRMGERGGPWQGISRLLQ